MDFETVDRGPTRYAFLRHLGPYPEIGSTFGRMASVAGASGLLEGGEALFVGVYHDDPSVTPPEALRSDAGVTVAQDATVPSELQEATLAGGRHAKGVHKGSYSRMSESWMALLDAIHRSDVSPRMAPPFEIYISDMDTTAEEDLITELYVPVD